MSLINEALKRAEAVGRNGQTPPAKRSMHGIKYLYADKATSGPDRSGNNSEEEISRLSSKNQTSLRGAAALGVCVIATVAVIMHMTLPPDQRGPVEAEAGDATAAIETQMPQPAGETKATADKTDKTTQKSPITALQQTLAGVLNGGSARIPKPARKGEPAPTAKPAVDEPNPVNRPASDQFTLSGIMASGGKGYAIVNGHMVTVGDDIDGARVVTIGKHHVVLEKDSKRLVLRM